METKNNHFDRDLNNAHLVAVTKEVLIETPDKNVTKVIDKGVYAFTNWKVARAFTTSCNDLEETQIAFYFKRTTQQKENENDEYCK